MTTMEGVVTYVSQNVNNYLGLYQVRALCKSVFSCLESLLSKHDMIGRSILDYVHKEDLGEVKETLLMNGIADPESKYSFFCRIKCTVNKMPCGVSKSPGYKVRNP